MARNPVIPADEKIGLLRQMAFQVHRKRDAEEVFQAYLDEQFQKGRRREFRAAGDAMGETGLAAALQALEILGEEGAVLLDVLLGSKDHRLIAAGLNALADYLERSGGR